MNMLTDIHKEAKNARKGAIDKLQYEYAHRYFSPEVMARLQEQTSKLFPILETCRRI